MNFANKNLKLIGYILLICLIPILLVLTIFNFIKYEQNENIKHINVAIVNEDEPAKFKGKTVNVGKQVQKTLSSDHQVKWHFVDEQTANKNIGNGHYNIEIILPEDFSKNATTALNKNPRISELKIETSQNNNFLAGVITSQVVDQMKSKVVKNIQLAYNQASLKAIGELGKGITQASSGVKKLDTASGQLTDGSKQISDNLHVLKDGTKQLANGAGPLQSGTKQLTDGSDQLYTGTKQLSTGVKQLSTGTKQLSTGTKQLSTGSKQLDDGLNLLNTNSPTLVSGANQLDSGVVQLASGSDLLTTKLSEASKQIDDQLNSNKADLDKLQAGLTTLNDGIQDLATQINAPENDNSAQITDNLTAIADNTQSTGDLLKDTGNHLQNVNLKVYDVNSPDSVASHLQNTGNSLLSLQDIVKNPDVLRFMLTHPDIMKQLLGIANTAKSDLEAAKTQLEDSGNNDMLPMKDNLTQMGNLMVDNGDKLLAVKDQLTFTQDNMAKLKAGVNQMARSDQAPTALNGAKEAINTLTAGLNQVNLGLKQTGNTTSTMGGIQATQQIHDGLLQVKTGLEGKTGQLGLVPGLITYTNGVKTAHDGSTQLYSGATQLDSGAAQVDSGATQLLTGTDQLNTGAKQLNTGLLQLGSQTPTLVAGINKLDSGAGQLATGSDTLNTGLNQAADGIGLLNIKLTDGSKQVKGLSTGSQNVDHFVTPVANKVLNSSDSDNLVNVFAPIIMTLILFVGAMLTQLTLSRKNDNSIPISPIRRISTIAGVIIGQSILITAFAQLFGLEVIQPFAFFMFNILIDATFTLACIALDKLFGTLGILVSFALLFLQLIVTGGILPNEMLSKSYRIIAIFLPGTYSFNGLEQVINGSSTQLLSSSSILLLFCVIFLGIIFSTKIKNLVFNKKLNA